MEKYPKTLHLPFSKGISNDDKVCYNYYEHICKWKSCIVTEKLDGGNACVASLGAFDRSHLEPTIAPWSVQLRMLHNRIGHSLGNLKLFGENMEGIHSIEYTKLTEWFYLFGVQELDRYLSWEEVKEIAYLLDLQTVPEHQITFKSQKEFETKILDLVSKPSVLSSIDTKTGLPCTMEGVVVRNSDNFTDFSTNVFKWVREGHVNTDSHWSKNWKRAKLINYG